MNKTTLNAATTMPITFGGNFRVGQPILFIDQLVFTPDPETMTQTVPPRTLSQWLEETNSPSDLGQICAAAPLVAEGFSGLILFFEAHYCFWLSDPGSPIGLGSRGLHGPYSKIANLPAGFSAPDAAYHYNGQTYLLKDGKSAEISVQGIGQVSASDFRPFEFASSLPPDWPKLDALMFLPNTDSSLDGSFEAFSEDQVASWEVVNSVAGPTTIQPLWAIYTGLPVSAPPSLPSGGHGKRGPFSWPVPRGFSITEYIRNNEDKVESTKQLAYHIHSAIGLGRHVEQLSWSHGPSQALQTLISNDLMADEPTQRYRVATREVGDGSIYIGGSFSGGIVLGGGASIGIGISTAAGDPIVAEAGLYGGGAILGASGGATAAYFLGPVDTQLGGGAFISGHLVTGPVGVVATAFFGASGFLGFAVTVATGVEVGGEAGGGYVWDMGQWGAST